ncbi:MAG TPA: 2-polyprenylphenol 6-hydroxylase [Caulobacteraceae bacterium]|nr:2-polyprenylphenol 6-hydroxylase [Caulobacteraceae bacterium]
MSDFGSFVRLVGAGWVLARNDALIPRELEPLLPARARVLGKLARLFAGRQARIGRPGERMARALEHLGPVSIKLGQVMSTRADIFGRDFAEDLGRLKDRLPPFPTEQARQEIERSLGRSLESLYATFEPPVAAASLAQAHPAVLLDGRKVAVKVLRPGVERRILRDIGALTLAARFAQKLGAAARRLEPEALAATVARSLQLELDLRFEAAGASELAEVMARDGYMYAPEVVWSGVGKRVLTLTWAEGLPLSEPAALEQPGLNRKVLADNLIRAFLAQALDHGVFHADLHEGNLFVAAPARMTAVDFGIIGRLGKRERRYLAEILYGFLERNYRQVAQSHFDAGYVPAHHSVDSFAQALRAVGEPIFGHTAQDVSMGVVLAQLFEITALFDMRLRPELVLLQKTMMVTEGVARRLDPEHDIWKAADPVVRRYILRELGPAARIRQLLEDGLRALEDLARRAEAPAVAAVHEIEREEQRLASRFTWFAVGAGLAVLVAGAAFAAFEMLR